MQIVDILKAAQQQNSSDIHIAPGNPVMLRIDGMLVPQGNQVLSNVETDKPAFSNCTAGSLKMC
mgnify:CR=1 FL=1